MKRYLESQVRSDLKRKMVFVGGPRQVGKTTLARNLLGKSSSGLLNWDVPAQRDLILRQQILVTGSARLDYYRFVGEDLVSVEQLQDLGSIELLMSRLPDLVGSPLSINGLVEQMQISHKTLSKWIDVLERLYTIFVVLPFNSPKIKALRKARKHYYYDWSLVREPSFRFENVVASHLL
jgi:predicted AAA+ superfamily ATPase